MTIRITVEAMTAAEAKQLVHDLAGTMATNPDVPANTLVSTIPTPAQPAYLQAAPQAPVAPPIPQTPAAPSYPLQQPAYPSQQPTYPVQQPSAPAYPVQQQPVQQQMGLPVVGAAPPPSGVPVAETTYTMDQLGVAATSLIDAGRIIDVQNLLAAFGVPALTVLPKEHYGMFATKLRELGAKL